MKTSEFIPKTKKKAKLKSVGTPTSEIPEDLQAQWEAIQAVATAFACLNKGLFSHDYLQPVKTSLMFLMKMHENCVTEALKHPKADLLSELKEVKAQMDAQKSGVAQDGKTTEQ